MTVRRRDLLVAGGVVAGIYGLRALPWGRMLGQGPDFVPVPGLAPFRRLAGQSGPPGNAALVGLPPATPDTGPAAAQMAAVRADPCRALYGGAPADGLAIAFFSDVQCPSCRVLERDLAAILAQDEGLRLVPHEWPIFGPASERAARAAIAADDQDGRAALHRRFIRAPLMADDTAIAAVSRSAGLDADRLLADMARPEVAAELARSAALARAFGFPGTPGLVIGRTVIDGAVPPELIREVIAAERALPPLAC